MPSKTIIKLAIVPVQSVAAPLSAPLSWVAPENLDAVCKVIVPLPKEVLDTQQGVEAAHVVVMIPAAILVAADITQKAIAIDVTVPSEILLASEAHQITIETLVVPVAIDMIDEVEAIIAIPQALRPHLAIRPVEAQSSSVGSVPLSSLARTSKELSELRESLILLDIPMQRLNSRNKLTDKVISLSMPFPAANDAELNINMVLDVPIATSLLNLVDDALSVSSLAAQSSTPLRTDADMSADWQFDQEPVAALIDAHILFAQECLKNLEPTPNIVIKRRGDGAPPEEAVAKQDEAQKVKFLRLSSSQGLERSSVLLPDKLPVHLAFIKPVLITKKKAHV